jgi:hypothetical protein
LEQKRIEKILEQLMGQFKDPEVMPLRPADEPIEKLALPTSPNLIHADLGVSIDHL